MKCLFSSLVLLVGVGCLDTTPEPQVEIVQKCRHEAGLTEDEIRVLHKPIHELTEKKNCFLGCLYEAKNFFENKDEIAERVGFMIKDESVKKELHECFKKIGTSESCQLGRDLYTCIKKAGLE